MDSNLSSFVFVVLGARSWHTSSTIASQWGDNEILDALFVFVFAIRIGRHRRRDGVSPARYLASALQQ